MRAALLASVCALGCTIRASAHEPEEVAVLRAIPNRDLDILFVIDNSPSMLDEQSALAQNFPRMIDVLQTLDAGLPNLHIGVVTSDMGTTGSTSPTPGPGIGSGYGSCDGYGDDGVLVQGAGVTDRYLIDLDAGSGARLVNYSGALRDAFSSLAIVGDTGCGFEQHLRAMRRALDNPLNAGFVRPQANLAIVIIADEDDCSAATTDLFGPDTAQLGPLASFRCFQFGVKCSPDNPTTTGAKTDCVPRVPSNYIDPVGPFADYLVNLKGDPRMVMASGIVGDPTSVVVALETPPGGGTAIPQLADACAAAPSSGAHASPAVRLASFFERFAPRSQLTSLCNGDLTTALVDIGASAKRLMGDPCIDVSTLADVSPEPGVQPSCEVFEVRDSAPDEPHRLPLCDQGSGDCYELVADATACPLSADHTRLRLYRTGDVAADTWTHVRCIRQ